tara:strand:- start:3170 stop:3394 length:225 start_codon:yes stop_codon:yes gene_type:complete
MPYRIIKSLPKSVRDNLPKGAQRIYLEVYNNAWKQYKTSSSRRKGSSREETSHKVAWSAVKKMYKKGKNKWIKK